MNLNVLSFRKSTTNPYDASPHAPSVKHATSFRPGLRFSLLAVAALAGLGNTTAALIDAYKERYPHLDGYLFIGITTVIPL